MEEMSLVAVTGSCDIRIVKKANSLIQLNRYIDANANTSLSLLEAKVIAYLISELDSTANRLHPVTLDFKNFWHECGIKPDSQTHYKLLMDAIMNLRSRATWVMKQDPATGEMTAVPVSWLEGKPVVYTNKAVVQFDPDLAPALLLLRDNYTQYPLSSVLRLNSKYGFALYEYISSYIGTGKPITMTLQKVAEVCDASNYLSSPSDMRKRVIAAAVEDIKRNSVDLSLDFELIKTGRKITHVQFTAVRKELPGALSQKALSENLSEEERWSRFAIEVKTQIGYESLHQEMMNGVRPDDLRTLELIVEVMTEVYMETKSRYTINGTRVPGRKVVERFKELKRDHIEFVLNCVGNTKTTICSPIPYLRASLFNAPMTMELKKNSAESAKRNRIPNGFDENGNRELGEDEIAAIKQLLAEDMDDFCTQKEA